MKQGISFIVSLVQHATASLNLMTLSKVAAWVEFYLPIKQQERPGLE